MKIKMQGSELKKVDIEYLSLVKRGANRSPFKVVKSEDQPGLVNSISKFFQMSEPTPQVVAIFVEKSALAKALPNLADSGFTLDNHEEAGDSYVFKQEGFDTDDGVNVVIVKSESSVAFAVSNVVKYADCFTGQLSFDPRVEAEGMYPGINAALGALQGTIGNLVAGVVKTNDLQASIAEQSAAFNAYVTQLSKALPESVAKFENLQRGFGSATSGTPNGDASVKTPSDIAKAAAELADKLLKAAGKKGATTEASEQVGSSSSEADANSTTSTTTEDKDDSTDDQAAKMRKGADDKVSSETVGEDAARKANGTDTSQMKKTEEKTGLVKKSYRPKVMKDAEGKEYVMAFSPEGLVMKYTPGAKIPEGHTCMTEEWDQDGALGGTNNGNGQGQGKAKASETSENEVKHTGAGGDRGNMDGASPAGSLKKLETLIESLAELPGLVGELAKSVAAQGEQIAAIEKTAKEAVKKAEGTVLHASVVHDSAYENMGGRRAAKPALTARQIAKAEFPDSLWTGSLGALEAHIPGVESV